MISICSCGALGLDLGLGELALELVVLLVAAATSALLDLDVRGSSTCGLRGLHLGDQAACGLLLQLAAVEPGEQVALLDDLAVLDRDLDDDPRRPGRR